MAEVNPGSPAEKAGIQRGDIIIEFNGHPIHEMNELPRLVADTAPGAKANVKILREGKEKSFTLTISELTEEKQAAQAKEEGGGEETPLGLLVKNIDPNLAKRFRLRDTKGALVVGVEQGSAAADAGIRPGDILLEIDGQVINSAKDFQAAVAKLKKETYCPLPDQAPGPHPVPDGGNSQVIPSNRRGEGLRDASPRLSRICGPTALGGSRAGAGAGSALCSNKKGPVALSRRPLVRSRQGAYCFVMTTRVLSSTNG